MGSGILGAIGLLIVAVVVYGAWRTAYENIKILKKTMKETLLKGLAYCILIALFLTVFLKNVYGSAISHFVCSFLVLYIPVIIGAYQGDVTTSKEEK